MSEIQRYELVFNEYLGAGIGLCDTGKYVQYTDHLADHQRIIAEKDAEIERLREAIEMAIKEGEFLLDDGFPQYVIDILSQALNSKGGSDE